MAVLTMLTFCGVLFNGMALSTLTKRVLVTGAGGQTGSAVIKKLALRASYSVRGLVRTEESKASLITQGLSGEVVMVGSCTDSSLMSSALEGCDALIICTSAKPVVVGKTEEGRPMMDFPNGQPEEVDWLGQKSQIDAAIACGVKHVVVCSSMGGTNPANMLNSIGRSTAIDGSVKGGNILLWKRKAEMYLMKSGLTYTIVHPGGLLNEPGGRREIIVGVDDAQIGTSNRSIPREDVAEVQFRCVILQRIGYSLVHVRLADRFLSLAWSPKLSRTGRLTCARSQKGKGR
jgi:NAD(P)-dependent dehydrogenase (short-subunit alcohol dehydrogenase family)